MKRILSVMIVLMLTLSFEMLTFSLGGNDVEILFKVGNEFFNINGKVVKAEKAIIQNGTTLVPVRIITEAFGLTIKWDGSDKSIEINSGGRIITLYVGNKQALIDGTPFTLLMEPIISNGRTLVPIRFISENLGADVGFNDQTKEVSVVKSFVKSNSIKDYAAIIKKSVKPQMGDSYNSWKMNFLKNLKMSERSFDGLKTVFESSNGSTEFKISIAKKQNETLEALQTKFLNSSNGAQLLSQRIIKGIYYDYLKVSMKKDNFLIEDREIITNDKIYSVVISSKEDKYVESQEVQTFLNSFDLNCKSGDINVEDFSDVSADGFHEYKDNKFKWLLDVPSEWMESKDETIKNVVEFSKDKNNLVRVEMNSIESGETLEKILEDETKYINERCNPARYKVISTNTYLKGKKSIAVMISEYTPNVDKYHLYEIFSVGKKYKFHVTASFEDAVYSDAEQFNKIKKIVNSFDYEEPDSSVTDLFPGEESKNKPEVYKILANAENKWKMEIPDTWVATKESDDKSTFTYHEEKYRLSISFTANKGSNLDEFLKYYEVDFMSKMATVNSYKNISKETSNLKGTRIIKYSNELVVNNALVKEYFYVMIKNEMMYTFSTVIRDVNNTPKNLEVLSHIWNSFEI